MRCLVNQSNIAQTIFCNTAGELGLKAECDKRVMDHNEYEFKLKNKQTVKETIDKATHEDERIKRKNKKMLKIINTFLENPCSADKIK